MAVKQVQVHSPQLPARRTTRNCLKLTVFLVEDYQRYSPIWPIGIVDKHLRRRSDILACVNGIDHMGAGVLTDMAV
jgi:hypothetical protein